MFTFLNIKKFEYYYNCFQVEEILRDNISEHWKSVADVFVKADSKGTGKVKKSTLRRIIEKFAIAVSDEHFAKYGFNFN